jgi:hypothetical protein
MNFLDKFTTQQRNLYISAFKYFTTTDASNWSLKNYTTYVRGISKQYHCSKKVLLEIYQFSLSECLLKSLIDQTTFNIKHAELVKYFIIIWEVFTIIYDDIESLCGNEWWFARLVIALAPVMYTVGILCLLYNNFRWYAVCTYSLL